MQINIREASLRNIKVIQELYERLLINDRQFDSTLNVDWPASNTARRYFVNRLENKDGVGFIAKMNTIDVGYLVGSIVPSYAYRTVHQVAELENMYVLEEYRCMGVGEELGKAFFRWCKNKKVLRVKVEISAGNDRALNFYKKLGFKDYVIQLEGIMEEMKT